MLKITSNDKYNQDIVNYVMDTICEKGIYIDKENAEEVYNDISSIISENEQSAIDILPEELKGVNLNSNNQIVKIMNNYFDMSSYAERTKSNGYSYKKEVLERIIENEGDNLAGQFAYYLKEYKSWYSLRNKVKEVVSFMDENNYVHPSWSHCETNRIHFSKPALSNLHNSVRSIISAPPGYKLIKVDYRQQEPYIMVNMLGIDYLKREMEKSDDFYAAMVKVLTGKEIEPEHRDLVKLIWLAGTYGSSLTNIPVTDDELEFIKELRSKILNIPEITEFKNYIRNVMIPQGKNIVSYFGTQREYPRWIKDVDKLERVIFNNTIQITGADILFFAMESCLDKFNKLGLPEDVIRIYLTLHDEITFLAREDVISEELIEEIKDAMILDIEGWSKIKVKVSILDNYRD